MKSSDHDSPPTDWVQQVCHAPVLNYHPPCDERWFLSPLWFQRYRLHQRLRGSFHPVGRSSPTGNHSSLPQQQYEELTHDQGDHLSSHLRSVSMLERPLHVQKDTPAAVSIQAFPHQKELCL